MIDLPSNVKYILDTLNNKGYEAYIVGGCVRDSIMGIVPHDWDITTSAEPMDVKACFKHTYDTGIKHGTITVLMDKVGYEVTTYRVDGIYEDNRRPKEVFFTRNLNDDLIRRDFTMNAIAYNERDGFVDLFGGRVDIENRIIRGVGCPADRFDEDALRMLRAVRFSSQLGFDIDEETFEAVKAKAGLLKNISKERIREEFLKLIKGKYADRMPLLWESGLLGFVSSDADDMAKMYGERITEETGAADREGYARLVIFLERLGDKKAETFMKDLKFDNKTMKSVVSVISNGDISGLENSYAVKKKLNIMGIENFELLLNVKKAQGKDTAVIKDLYDSVIENKECFMIKDLKINGNILMENGIAAGKEIGAVLNALLDEVMKEPSLNREDILLKKAYEIKL